MTSLGRWHPAFTVSLTLGLLLLVLLRQAIQYDATLSPLVLGRGTSRVPQCCERRASCLAGSTRSSLPITKASGVRGKNNSRGAAWFLSAFERIAGRLEIVDLAAIVAVSDTQRALGVYGSVGEIGIHHGKSFLALALAARFDEPLWACDLFDELQVLNVDSSGRGNKSAFLLHLSQAYVPATDVRTFIGSSHGIDPCYFHDNGMPPFRFMSIDGGHTAESALADVFLAACNLAPGGVIAIDDFHSRNWMSVDEGVYEALLDLRDRLAPFLVTNKKLYMTTATMHAPLLKAVFAHPLMAGAKVDNYTYYPHTPGRTQIAGWDVVSPFHWKGPAKARFYEWVRDQGGGVPT
jgi:hypothetical protein